MNNFKVYINDDYLDYEAEQLNNVTILKYTDTNLFGKTNEIAIKITENNYSNYKIIIDGQIIYLDIFQAEKIAAALIIATGVKIDIK